jgi:type I restriction enzyme M protein
VGDVHLDEHVCPFLRPLRETDGSFSRHVREARLGFSNAKLLAKAVTMLEAVEMVGR